MRLARGGVDSSNINSLLFGLAWYLYGDNIARFNGGRYKTEYGVRANFDFTILVDFNSCAKVCINKESNRIRNRLEFLGLEKIVKVHIDGYEEKGLYWLCLSFKYRIDVGKEYIPIAVFEKDLI